MQQHDPVGEAHREIEVVQHRDHGGAVAARAACAVSTRSIWWRMSRLEVGSSSSSKPGPCSASPQASCTSTRAKCARCCSPPDSVGNCRWPKALQADLVQRRIDQRLRRGAAVVAGAHGDDLLDREGKGDVDMLRQHRAMLRRAGAADRCRCRAALSSTWPRSGGDRRTACRSSVDLPAPLGPTIATISPAAMRKIDAHRPGWRRRCSARPTALRGSRS